MTWRAVVPQAPGRTPQAPGPTPRGREAPLGCPGAEDQPPEASEAQAERPRGRQTDKFSSMQVPPPVRGDAAGRAGYRLIEWMVLRRSQLRAGGVHPVLREAPEPVLARLEAADQR